MKNEKTAKGVMLYTVHGTKRPQGMLARVNNRIALTYIKGTPKSIQIEGYSYLDELIDLANNSPLPEFRVDY